MRTRWRLPPVFGPLFGYDLIASTRRGQHSGLRVLIAVLLLLTLYIVYATRVAGFDPFANPFKPGTTIRMQDSAEFAHDFAKWCLIVQFAAVIILTPIVVSDAVARDKERRALDYLFVTALTDREIILGKFGSRVAYMGGVILTGLPILALIELFGGIEPALLFSSYAAVLATLLSLGAMCLYCSVVSNTAVQATVRAYAWAVVYMFVCPCMIWPTVQSSGAVLGIIAYVIVNVILAAALIKVSINDLRPRAESALPVPATNQERKPAGRERERAQESDEPKRPPPDVYESPDNDGWGPVDLRYLDAKVVWEPTASRQTPLPPVDERRPLLWKEIYLHSLVGSAAGGPKVVCLVLLLASALAGLSWVVVATNPESGGDVAGFGTAVVKVGTVILGGLLALGAMIHAVNGITREWERETLDALLTLPFIRDTVLAAKWLGGLASLRFLVLSLAGVWVFGLLTGGLHPFAFVVLALAVAAVIEFLTSLGLWLSVICKTSLRANIVAVFALLVLAFGPLIAANYLELLWPNSIAHRRAADAVTDAVMPVLAWLRACVGWREYSRLPEGYLPTILCGALGYAVTAWLIWRATLARFRRYGGRRK
jgi:ABC-type transport system involved in multi-copper enzyme maturation permease subunit